MERILVAKNKKAFYNYHIIDRYEAGLVLSGSEVKSMREGKMNFEKAVRSQFVLLLRLQLRVQVFYSYQPL